MTAPILVTGGTGTLGRLVVARLREAGRDVRVLSRHEHDATDGVEYVACDLRKGEGLAAAVAGVEIIMHLAGAPKGDAEATRNLVQAARVAGAKHLVYISVTAPDQIPLGYFKAKLASERIVAESGIPYTTLRAAQFHDLVLTMAQKMAKLPVAPVPSGMRLQPVDADEVAALLVELALRAPAGLVPDLVGPTVHRPADLVRDYLRARGKHRLILPIRLPGNAGRAYRSGANLSHGGAVGQRTWGDFLAERTAAEQDRTLRVITTPAP